MKRILSPVLRKVQAFVIFISLSAVLSAQIDRTVVPPAGPAPKINIGQPAKFTLSNGLKVFVVENNKIPAVSYQLTLELDPVLEGAATGYVSLAGALMKTGTTTKTKAQIDEAVDFIGATLTPQSNGFYGSALKKHSVQLLEIMSDVLLNPIFPQDELDKSVTQTKSALQIGKDAPMAIAANIRKTLLFGPNDPYGEIMTEETLDNITVEALKKYHETYFRPNVAYLVIVGDITAKEAKKQAEKYFGKQWKRKDVPKHVYEYPKDYTAPKVAIANRDGAVQSSIFVSHTVRLTPGHPDAIKADVMNDLLGGGSWNAKLFHNLREDKGYTYATNSVLSPDKRLGDFIAWADVRTSVTDSALHEMLKEIRIMRNELVSDDAISLTKNMMTGNFSRSLEDPQTIARFALNVERYKLPADYYTTYLEKLAAVTPRDVQEMAKKYLRPDNAVILAVGDASAIRERMKVFSPIGEVTEYNYYGKEVVTGGIPAGVTPKTVIQAYIDAIGGEKALKNVKDMKTVSKLSVQGMEIEMVTLQKAPNKVRIEQKMMGNVLSLQIFNGERGKVASAMGEQVLEGEQAAAMKEAAVMFAELKMLENTDNLELVSIDDIDGKEAYKMNVSKSNGATSVVYFDVKTGYKLREVNATPQGAVSTSFDDYTDFSGVKIPVTMKMVVGPQAIDVKVVEVEINKGIGDSEFEF